MNNNNAKTLNMTELTYVKSINYLSNLDKKIQLVSNQLNISQVSKPDYIQKITTTTDNPKPLISQSN
ncbi:MAG: hypothetical protein WCG25_07600 [bacterium]